MTGIPGSVSGWRSVTIALAPLAFACAANASPWVRRPGIAKKASPGWMARLSALMPSTRSRGGLAPAPFSSSVSANDTAGSSLMTALADFRGDKLLIQHLVEVWADSKHRRYALHNAARCFTRIPAGGAAGLLVFVARLVDQDHHRVARIVEREGRREYREGFGRIVAAVHDLFRRAGLAARPIARRE